MASGIPAFCSSPRAPPPAPTKTNFAFSLRFSPVRPLTSLRSHPPSLSRLMLRTSVPKTALVPLRTPKPTNCFDSSPKSTSVPSWLQFKPTGSAKSRPAAINGRRRANSSSSLMNSIFAKSGLPTRASWRLRRNSTLSAPCT
ncbi:Uncharacterised protein [Mycobacteroides abscessus subsp. abscessus]|nr:Uncharacterised protein [Mycobacteroides abscessus subsp. abscessus]